jgi:hypothetical protein
MLTVLLVSLALGIIAFIIVGGIFSSP